MKYIALKSFVDLQDKKYRYVEGDTFPREGKKVTKKRIAELLSSDNKRHEPMIKAVEEEEE